MKLNKVAAIDIGSNAVRLLISSLSSQDNGAILFNKALMVRIPLRLGEDTFSVGKITKIRSAKLIKVMKSFKDLMDVYGVEEYKAYATSAMREAKNGQKLAKKIEEKTGVKLEIISGSEEANMIYESHVADKLNPKKNYLFVDVGGGSTEISLIVNGNLTASRSFRVGTIRMLQHKVEDAELNTMNEFLSDVKERFAPVQIIGSGGNINKLYKLAKLPKNRILTVPKLQEIYNDLNSLSLDDRMTVYSLNADRADVIIPASEIFLQIAKVTNIQEFFVPTFGLVDGIVHSIAQSAGLFAQKE